MKLYYVFDIYCGWCYGFEAILKPFIENHPELDVNVLSGGLFTSRYPISAYPHIEGANKRIADMFGVTFLKPYQELLKKGDLIPDSNDAAIAFGILRDLLPKSEHVHLAYKMHKAFYQDGKSLSEVETIKTIAGSYNLPLDYIEKKFESMQAEGKYHPDFYAVQKFGVTAFPTLFVEIEGKYYDIKGNATTLEALEQNFNTVLKRNGIINQEAETAIACALIIRIVKLLSNMLIETIKNASLKDLRFLSLIRKHYF